MKARFTYTLFIVACWISTEVQAQDADLSDRSTKSEIQTVFSSPHTHNSGAYGALSNKFTSFNGEFANMVGFYGGWFVNKKLLIGVGAAATTNNLPVAEEFAAIPNRKLSYEFGQVGLMTEYVIASDRVIHVSFNLLTGAGFTTQYERYHDDGPVYDHDYNSFDDDWFFVVEPGIQVEINVLRWMRFSPGVSYRLAQGSHAAGLSDSDISGASMNLSLKFGKF